MTYYVLFVIHLATRKISIAGATPNPNGARIALSPLELTTLNYALRCSWRTARMNSKDLYIFVSSPGDVSEERAITQRVVERLKGEFVHKINIVPIFWEHEPLLASGHF